MKLVVVIVSNKDIGTVLSATGTEGFMATKISTQGQFLQSGHTTVLYGVEDDRVDTLFDILEKNVSKRVVRSTSVTSTLEGSLLKQPVDVEEFGAVAFVVNVEEFKKL